MDTLPVTRNRTTVAVGPRAAATKWARTHRPHQLCLIAETLNDLAGLDPRSIHLVILPEWRDLRSLLLIQIEIWLLQRHGATLELA